MIISHKYRFIFIKTQKTAGTSIEISLSRYCGTEDIVTPISLADESIRAEVGSGPQNYLQRYPNWAKLLKGKWERGKRFWNHMSASSIQREVGPKIWNSYFKFSFERNPWDKTISLFYYRLGTGSEHRLNLDPNEFIRTHSHELPVDFEQYSIGNKLAVDRICQFERLEDELSEVCVRLGIPFDGWLPKAKGNFRHDRRPHWQVFEPDTRGIVSEKFRREIEMLGYRFEPAESVDNRAA